MNSSRRRSRSTSALLELLLAVSFCASAASHVRAQGCVASPNNPLVPIVPCDSAASMAAAERWLGAVSYRWYQSDRMFGGRSRAGVWLDGDQENTDRQKYHQETINSVHLMDVSASYGITHRWSATLTLPFIFADRSSVFEHTDGQRHSMHAGGVGDVRIVTDYWLLDPHQHMEGNVALGIGFKAPTGDDKASDLSYRATGPVYRPVDQSIQPGDGGWGMILEIQAYQQVFKNLYGYVQGSYLFAPKEHNDTQTVMADLMPPGPMTFNSIGDQYFGRGGFSYFIWPKGGVTLSLGARIEGVPVYDVIGDSLGFRQPGYTISVEPGVSWTGKKNSLSILAPVAAYRIRQRSAPEIELGRHTGEASFADFSILASFSHRF